MAKGGNISVIRLLRVVFGLFMIVVYFGMAYLLAVNFFDWNNNVFWNIVRWSFASILALYGIYRCYRQVKGIDYYRLNDLSDDDNDE